MTNHGNGRQPVEYSVQMSEQTKNALKQQYLASAHAGKGQQFLIAFRQIIERLRTDPLTFGEPQYRLPVLHLLVRQGVVSPLIVDYAVHEEMPFVFIRGFKLLS